MVSERRRSVGLSRAVGLVFVVQQVALVGACSKGSSVDSPPAAPSGTEVVKAALNASPRTSDFIFEATKSIWLHSAPLTVNGGDVGARGTGSGPFLSGGVAIDISSGAVVQTTHNMIADSIRLNTGINVGDLQTNRLVNPNAGQHGSVTPLVPLPALPAPAAVTPGTTNLTVAGGKTVTASPGQFLTVSLGTSAVLRLNAGTYQMRDLTVGTSGRIEALGAVQIRIANRLNAGTGFFIGPATGTTLTAKDIRIEVSGINGTDGALGSKPKAATLASNGNIRALVLVPNGTLSFATGMCAKGAFLARDIDVESSNAAYTFEDGFPNAGTCTPAGCDDHNACTTDTCAADGTCTHTNVGAGTSCSDGNACNGAETCNASGACQAGTPVTCTASDACHIAGTCNPATGVCSNPSAPAGTSCSDGNACNGGETCNGSGACQPGTPVTCTASDACHVAGTCSPATGVCSNPPASPGTSCSDGNACNGAETCNGAGLCTPGTPVTCVAADACHLAGTCDPATGACSNPPASTGTSCSDGNACNGAETCDGAGACRNGTPVTCTASDQCHAPGVCNPTTGTCSNPAKPDGTACDDTSACTQTDTCQGGSCNGSNPVTCTAQDECHDVGTCASASGQCSNPLKPAGTPCGSGGTCTAEGTCAAGNNAPVVNAGPDQTVELRQGKAVPSFTLQRLSTPFNNPVGIEYHPPTNKMMVSVYWGNGQPHNFELIAADGTHEQFSNVSGLTDEVYFAIPRDEGGGRSIGGFIPGELYTGTGAQGVIARISPDGSTIDNPWVTLPGETGLMRGQLQFDRTGLYGGDLIVTTTAGHLWRVTAAGEPTMLASLGCPDCEGLTVAPNDPDRYGPWAGRILIGDEATDAVWAVDATGDVQVVHIGLFPENINIVPANENFFGVDFGSGFVMGASASQFRGMVGDVLISEEFGGRVWDVQWDGITFRKTQVAQVAQWEHTAFGPAPVAEIGDANALVALSGTATDDGRPPGSVLSTTWSVVDAPAGGVVTFTDSHAPSTTAFLPQPGTYVLRLTATDGTLTTTDDVTITVNRVTPHNEPPVAKAGPDQTITIPEFAVLTGSASDDGVPIGSEISLSWTQESGPATVVFGNSSAGLTAGLFAVAGTYVLRLDASDGELTGSDTVTITVNPETAIAGGTLTLTPSDPGPMPLGAGEYVTAVLLDASATPVPHFPIVFTLTGANPGTATYFTDATGVAILPYTGRYPGVDSIFATATGFTQSLTSNTVSVTWLDIPVGTPLLTQGWIKSPIHQGTVTEPVRVELSDQITLTSGTLSYWPYAHPDKVRTLATGLTTGPGGTMAMFDPTVLSNGSYVIDLSATDNTGRQRESEVLIVVDGEYKPGRVVVEIKDFEVPLAGLPITIGRRYDSLEKDEVGDFGYGWNLMIGHPKLEKDLANNVTLTMPNGRRSTFYFGGRNPVLNGGPVVIVIGFLMFTGYTPAQGLFGTLTSDGCPVMTINPFNDSFPTCFPALSPAELLYSPTEYTYTDPNKTVYVMGANGELRSITDRQGNSLTFTRNGIFSSTGKNVIFNRDPEGRIETVDYPAYFQGQDYAARYAYDPASGDLTEVNLAKIPFVFFRNMSHTYYGGAHAHRLKTSIDANRNTVRTSEYYDDGRLKKDTDALQHETDYTYDLVTRTTTTRFHDQGEISQTFDAHGLVVSETDQRGNRTTYEYDENLQEKRKVNALNEETRTEYNTFGSPTAQTTPKGTATIEYNQFNQATAMTDRVTHRTTFEYDSNETISRVADEDGTRFKFTNSEQGVPLVAEDAEGHLVHFAYDAAGNETARTDRLGRVTRATYDEAGHRLTETTARGGTTTNTYYLPGWLASTRDPSGYERTFTYDPNGNLVRENDSIGRQTNYTYNALNQLTEVTRFPESTTVKYTYDFRGNVLTMTDERGPGHTTTNEYDRAGNLIKTTFPDSTFTTRTYDALNRLESVKDERDKTTTYAYDPGCGCSNRIAKVTDARGTTETTYDGVGRKTLVKDANLHTTRFTYDPRGHLKETTFHDLTFTHEEYDSRGRRISMKDQTGATTFYGHDDEGQLTSVTDPLLKVTRYSYDLNGNLASVTDANNHKTSYLYDAMNRQIRRTLPMGQFETFTYDLAGRQDTHTDFHTDSVPGKTTTMTYDSRDRMLTKVPDLSLSEAPHIYTYTVTGKRLTASDASGVTTYEYNDPRDRLTRKITPAGTLDYEYDDAGNVARIHSLNLNGTDVSYGWDAANQLESVTDNKLGVTTTATYTATRRPLTLTQPNGVAVKHSYDTLDRVLSTEWRRGSSPDPFGSWAYTHNARGQRTSSTDITGRSSAYAYDPASRLTAETISNDPRGSTFNGELSYDLDDVGNRRSRSSTLAALGAQAFTYNANDQLDADTYDANGNTLTSDGHTFAYDFENRLVSKNGGAISITYDCDGNRVAKNVSGVATRYLVDDLNPTGYVQVLEEVAGGAVQARYTYGTGVISQTRNVSSTPATSYYGYDAHGNITFLTDTVGAVTDSYDYDAWGILVASTGSTVNTRLYTGEEFDPDLGLINLRARQYRPSTGRFLTGDPFDALALGALGPRRYDGRQAARPGMQPPIDFTFNTAALSRYVYANAEPVNHADPTGLMAVEESLLDKAWAEAQVVFHRLGKKAACLFAVTIALQSHLEGDIGTYEYVVEHFLFALCGNLPKN